MHYRPSFNVRVSAVFRFAVAGSVWFSCIATAVPDDNRLREYVETPDESYAFEELDAQTVGGATLHTLRLTSQTWRGMEWQHRVSLLLPENLAHPGTAVLVVGGGSNNRIDREVDLSRTEARIALQIASRIGCPVAVIEQVPNQPLYGGLSEDDLIAHTFAEFLRTGEKDWPLLLPMVKSAVRAMDAVSEFLEANGGVAPDRFIVTGGSKRGWTSWLTAAVDHRVAAIAPMVFDILNFVPQLDHQRASYGGYSEMIAPYQEHDLFDKLQTEPGETLRRTVDPYAYRDLFTMPKLVVLGTNDPYWTVDASGFYFGDLPQPRHLYYAPNAGHSLNLAIVPTLLGFFQSVLDDEPLPGLDWNASPEGDVEVRWDGTGGNTEAWVWSARSGSRDFREAEWRSFRLDSPDGNNARLQSASSESEWSAQYVEVRFELSNGLPFHACTEIFVFEPVAED